MERSKPFTGITVTHLVTLNWTTSAESDLGTFNILWHNSVSHKACHCSLCHNFIYCWPVLEIHWLSNFTLNLQSDPCYISIASSACRYTTLYLAYKNFAIANRLRVSCAHNTLIIIIIIIISTFIISARVTQCHNGAGWRQRLSSAHQICL